LGFDARTDKKSLDSEALNEQLNKFMWSDAYLITIEESFDEIFRNIYTE
jgi:hypothetical protein